MRPMKKIVRTGGPGVGKTTILKRLSDLECLVKREVFTEVFDAANQQGRFDELFKDPEKLIFEWAFVAVFGRSAGIRALVSVSPFTNGFAPPMIINPKLG